MSLVFTETCIEAWCESMVSLWLYSPMNAYVARRSSLLELDYMATNINGNLWCSAVSVLIWSTCEVVRLRSISFQQLTNIHSFKLLKIQFRHHGRPINCKWWDSSPTQSLLITRDLRIHNHGGNERLYGKQSKLQHLHYNTTLFLASFAVPHALTLF